MYLDSNKVRKKSIFITFAISHKKLSLRIRTKILRILLASGNGP